MDALDELGTLSHWVCWREEERLGATKPTKVPYSAVTRRKASSTDPATWTTLTAALDFCEAHPTLSGVGFVFAETDPYTGVDLDGCIDLETGDILPWARTIVTVLDSYTEYSPSGKGLHVIIRAAVPAGGNRTGPVEMYDRARYFTMTGRQLPGTRPEIAGRQSELAELHAALFAPDTPVLRAPPAPLADVPADDRVLLERMFDSNKGPEIRALWDGSIGRYDADDSRADLALASRLAYWTGNDAARMDRLFRQSRLYREKWDEKRGKRTYGERTITYVLSGGAG